MILAPGAPQFYKPGDVRSRGVAGGLRWGHYMTGRAHTTKPPVGACTSHRTRRIAAKALALWRKSHMVGAA